MNNYIIDTSDTDSELQKISHLVIEALICFSAGASATELHLNEDMEMKKIDSSTEIPGYLAERNNFVREIFQKASLENWEEGEFGDFAAEIKNYVLNFKIRGLEELDDTLRERSIPDDLKAEAFVRLGEIHLDELGSFIKYLLNRGLNSSSPIIRLGAITGIASYGDKWFISELEKKYSTEKEAISKKLIISAIEYLKKKNALLP